MIPVLLSIPHGGQSRPAEIDQCDCIVDAKTVFDNSDPYVDVIYDLGDKVRHVVVADVARTFVDLNRSLHDVPPLVPDGIIKSCTCYGDPVYGDDGGPDEALRSLLIKQYYMPYHRNIQKSLRDMDLQLCIDCHSMAAVAPSISPDQKGKKRPTFCISNWDGRTSSEKMINVLADCIAESFSVARGEVHINDPFHGGYITRTYGDNPVPWIQVEINRSMYMAEPWFDKDTLLVDEGRLKELNGWFADSLELFFSKNYDVL